MPADRSSWKTLPPPIKRQKLEIAETFSDAEADRIRAGFIPTDMDDHWFIYFEDGWLNFHRSWTGHQIYGIRFDGAPHGVRIVDAWASRDEDEYRSPGNEHDRVLVVQLLKSYFGDDGAVRS